MRRPTAFVLAAFVAATTTLYGALPAAAAPTPGAPARAPEGCSTEEWRNPGRWSECVGKLKEVSSDRAQCLKAPTPNAPDSGMAGWFATTPSPEIRDGGRSGLYSKYGYAGYSYTTYDIGCSPTLMHPDHKFENTIANGEFLFATSLIGASNALREKAWVPDSMWGWADPLVDNATKAVYDKVFTVFGGVTLAIVGLYLLWRSRQSDMSAAMTTTGWAILVMVTVTAVAAWPKESANMADATLTTSLSVVHGALGPQDESAPPEQCRGLDPAACKDNRPPSQRAADTATEGLLYRNWLRGLLGSSDSETAKRYGPVLYDARSLSWAEIEKLRKSPELRQQTLDAKSERWMRVAEQIKEDDPEAYEYLTGVRGMERIGAGFIAILAALFFSLFDITASILVLLGFLIFRWAVIAAPILGTVGLLRPASAGIRRLANAVVSAVFNIIIFGTAAAIYLYAVSLIIGTASLAGWLQVVLILLTGIVGWILLRPYRRITQLGGGRDPSRNSVHVGVHWFNFRHRNDDAEGGAAGESGQAQRPAKVLARTELRPEARGEDTAIAQPTPRPEDKAVPDTKPQQRVPQTVRRETEAVDDGPPSYAIYRPTPRTAPAPERQPDSEPARR